MKFEIKNRWSGEVQFTAEIDADEDTPHGIKVRLAVSWAIKNSANLTDANLTRASLTDANLTAANLTKIRDDFWAVLCSAPREVPFLRDALINGRVDGTTYSGVCACLVGTIANARHTQHTNLDGLIPNAERAAERFFLAIREGDTPESNIFSKKAVEWVDQWFANMRSAVDIFQGEI